MVTEGTDCEHSETELRVIVVRGVGTYCLGRQCQAPSLQSCICKEKLEWNHFAQARRTLLQMCVSLVSCSSVRKMGLRDIMFKWLRFNSFINNQVKNKCLGVMIVLRIDGTVFNWSHTSSCTAESCVVNFSQQRLVVRITESKVNYC